MKINAAMTGRSRGSREPCGLKFKKFFAIGIKDGRGSREPCGLKSSPDNDSLPPGMSRLARALWIEITKDLPTEGIKKSRLARALWIEIMK